MCCLEFIKDESAVSFDKWCCIMFSSFEIVSRNVPTLTLFAGLYDVYCVLECTSRFSK